MAISAKSCKNDGIYRTTSYFYQLYFVVLVEYKLNTSSRGCCRVTSEEMFEIERLRL